MPSCRRLTCWVDEQIASYIGIKDRFVYGMTKGAVLTMTYSVATDYMRRAPSVSRVVLVHAPKLTL
jgi:NAD(P)-dependent dehydrogenase (short-subunit alcohol dehydrogenase family)